jgi:DNA-binding CsgD family transcriptional regulator
MLKALSEDVLNRLDVAAILVDATGTPVLTNKHAQKILSDDSELMIENGKLTTTSLNSRRQLSELLRNVSQQRGDSAKEFALMKIQRSSSPIPLTVLVSCVGGMPEGAGRSAPMVLVLISNENQTIKVPAEIINLLYGLTPAESRLTLALVDGLELDEIATKFCVSQNTLRVQLRSIFKKTGVRRQSELVKLVLSGLAKYSA